MYCIVLNLKGLFRKCNLSREMLLIRCKQIVFCVHAKHFYNKTLPLVPMRTLCERFTPFFKLKTTLKVLHRELTIIFTQRHDLFLAINTYPDLLEQCQRIKISALTRRIYIVSKLTLGNEKENQSSFSLHAHSFIFLLMFAFPYFFFLFCMAWRLPLEVVKSK